MGKMICKFCRKPLSASSPIYDKMLEIMGLPEDSGAHAECLGVGTKVDANTEASRKLASPTTKVDEKGKV